MREFRTNIATIPIHRETLEQLKEFRDSFTGSTFVFKSWDSFLTFLLECGDRCYPEIPEEKVEQKTKVETNVGKNNLPNTKTKSE